MMNDVSHETSFLFAKFSKLLYNYFDAINRVETGQDRKIAALTFTICVHHFFIERRLYMNNDMVINKLINEANKAYKKKEIPIGAVVVYNNKIISRGYNKKESKKSPIYHAEIIAIDKACKKIGDWRLNKCILYTTLFPCPMCASAIQQSRIKKIIYINDTKNKFEGEISRAILNSNSNHIVEIEQYNCNCNLIQAFFKERRKINKKYFPGNNLY